MNRRVDNIRRFKKFLSDNNALEAYMKNARNENIRFYENLIMVYNKPAYKWINVFKWLDNETIQVDKSWGDLYVKWGDICKIEKRD